MRLAPVVSSLNETSWNAVPSQMAFLHRQLLAPAGIHQETVVATFSLIGHEIGMFAWMIYRRVWLP
jgi:hypothetical protein